MSGKVFLRLIGSETVKKHGSKATKNKEVGSESSKRQIQKRMGFLYQSQNRKSPKQQKMLGLHQHLQAKLPREASRLQELCAERQGGKKVSDKPTTQDLILIETKRLAELYGKSFLDCDNLIEITGLGRDNVRALMQSNAFPVIKAGNRKVVSIISFVSWQLTNGGYDYGK